MKIIHIIPNLKKGGAERLVQDICCQIENEQLAKIYLVTFHQNVTSKLSFHENIPSFFSLSTTSSNKSKVKELQKFISEIAPDIIHTHLWESELLLTQLKIGNTIRFSHLHDNMIQLSKKIRLNRVGITNKYERNFFLKNNLNNFICISKDTFEYAKRTLPTKLHNQIHLLNNSINFQKFYSKKNKSKDKIRLINIGSFSPKKNQTFAIDVVQKIIKKGYHVELTFLGDGDLIEKCKKHVTKLNLSSFVKFKGNVENVKDHLIDSNIYLHTAYYEPFGLVLLEAMAAGLPVVSLDGKGNRDFIVNGKNGYIFKNQDHNLFAEQIIELFEKQKLHEKISSNGQKTAKKYDIKKYVIKLLKLYKESISSTNCV